MKVYGITGGVGTGKSTVLSVLRQICKCEIIMADDVAKDTIVPGGIAYQAIVDLLGKGIVGDDGFIDRKAMSDMIFADENLRQKVNAIIHPATKKEIIKEIENARLNGNVDFVFVEAALLIEAHYEDICDEFWYIYAPLNVRIDRLMKSRGYSHEKSLSIINKQLTEEEFMKHCAKRIDNSVSLEETKAQLIRNLN